MTRQEKQRIIQAKQRYSRAKQLSYVTREHLTSSQRKDLISQRTAKMNRLEAEQVSTRYQQYLTQCRNETKTF